MMAGADEPATLSGFCQPMAIAMVSFVGPSIQGDGCGRRGTRFVVGTLVNAMEEEMD
jgi:hypothetical protein